MTLEEEVAEAIAAELEREGIGLSMGPENFTVRRMAAEVRRRIIERGSPT